MVRLLDSIRNYSDDIKIDDSWGHNSIKYLSIAVQFHITLLQAFQEQFWWYFYFVKNTVWITNLSQCVKNILGLFNVN